MGKIKFEDIFINDYLTVITSYCNRIQYILDEYDVAIFMARKAICLYSAMMNNGELRNTSCHVISSRVIDYDSLERFQNQKIAVIDDVVVKGESINQVALKLSEAGVNADYYVAVCEVSFAEQFVKNGVFLNESFTYYTKQEVYQLAGLITQYIEASMCSFNIDSPIYDMTDNADELRDLLCENGSAILTSNIQRKYGIQSKVLYFGLRVNEECKNDISFIEKGVLKIRFYFNENYVLAVPFILLPACNKQILDRLYSYIKCDIVDELVNCDNIRLHDENKFKIISYIFSEKMMRAFLNKYHFNVRKKVENDLFQFDIITDTVINSVEMTSLDSILEGLYIKRIQFDKFYFSAYVRKFYQYILSVLPEKQLYENALGDKIGSGNTEELRLERIAFSFDDLYKSISQDKEEQMEKIYISSLIDVYIDRGMIVPSIVHYDDNLITLRAYKMGEYSKLTRDQVNAFAKMLFVYQSMLDRDLDRTEFEKLCVLFFQAQITKNFFKENTRYEEGMYSIGYSLYGPRVSTGELRYEVDSDSAIITDFSINKLVDSKKKKYYITRDITIEDKNLRNECHLFAIDFAKLANVFKENPYNIRKNPWNKYVHTYNQFLVLLAIGESPKNQILSLCAELNLMIKLNADMFFKEEDTIPIPQYRMLLSGIESGLWKYRCFKNNAYEQTEQQICEYGGIEVLRGIISVRRHYDKNKKLLEILDKCGEILFTMAFVVNETLLAVERIEMYNLKKVNYKIGTEKLRTIFSVADYYDDIYINKRCYVETCIAEWKNTNRLQTNIKKWMFVLQQEAQIMLDWCDLYLEKDVPNYRFVKKFLILYSPSGRLQNKYRNHNSIDFVNISKAGVILVLPLDNNGSEIDEIIDEVAITTQEISDVVMLYFDMINDWESFVQIEQCAKGRYLEKIINKIIGRIDDDPVTMEKRFFHITPKEVHTFKNFKETKVNRYDEDTLLQYHIVKYTLRRKKEMTEKNTIQINGSVIGSSIVGGNSSITYIEKEGINVDEILRLLDNIRTVGDILPDSKKQEMEDYVETIQDMVQQEKPKRGLIKTAYEGLLKLCTETKFIDAVIKLSPVIEKVIENV